MKVLHLTLKKKWFDMIASGEKKEEYREMKLFHLNRFFKPDSWTSCEDYFPNEMLSEFIRFPEQNIDDVLKIFGAKRVKFDTVCFRNGYAKQAPKITVYFKGIEIGPAKPEWSHNWKGNVFVIKLGDILP